MMTSLVENTPVIYLGGQRARITEQRVRRGRIQFIQQEALFENSVKWSTSIEYAEQTDEIIRHALRVCQRSEEHTSELQSLMRISYAVFCLKKKKNNNKKHTTTYT